MFVESKVAIKAPFKKSLIIFVIAVFCLNITYVNATKADDFSLAYFMGPKHPMNAAVFTPFAERLEEVSGGALTVSQFPGGALNSSPPQQYSILLDGVTDIAFHLPGYTAQIFPISTSISTPGVCDSAIECTHALWRVYDIIEHEFDAKILALWSNAPPVLYTRDKPVAALNDLSGMILRVTSAQDIPFIDALGASAVSQPVSVINQNLTNGVIDGVVIDPSASMAFKMYEPANYLTTGIPGGGQAFVLLMNNDVYNNLSSGERNWVDEASGEWLSLSGAEAYTKLAQRGIDVARENGVEIINLSEDEQVRWREAIKPTLAAWLASDVGQNLTGNDIVSLMAGE